MDDHIHTRDDGRGPRRVYVDGALIDRVVYADTKHGIVKYHKQPLEINRVEKSIVCNEIRGKVTIEFFHES